MKNPNLISVKTQTLVTIHLQNSYFKVTKHSVLVFNNSIRAIDEEGRVTKQVIDKGTLDAPYTDGNGYGYYRTLNGNVEEMTGKFRSYLYDTAWKKYTEECKRIESLMIQS